MPMESLIKEWSGEYVVTRYDAKVGAWMFICAHSTRLGPASGGTRMKLYGTPDDGLRDAQRLSEGMTYKWAGVDFPRGGGKGVIALSRPLEDEEREPLLERYGAWIATLRGSFATGADLGVGPESVEVIGRRTEHVFGNSAGDPGPYTALGVLCGTRAMATQLFGGQDSLADRTVLIQGIGDVGKPLSRLLAEAGARLKLADVDVGRVEAMAQELDAEVVEVDSVYDEPCDIFSPCALGGMLNPKTIPRLKCRGVSGAANNQLESEEDAQQLHARGVLYAPDFINNAGGAIAICGLEALKMSEEEVTRRVESIGATQLEIFQEAKHKGESPIHAAKRRAERVLERGPAK